MIISTFPELHRPDRKRRLPSERASEELFEGMREAMHGAAAGSAGPSKAGTGMQMLTGVLGGLSDRISKMTDGPSTPMAPTMISDPVQVERDLSQLTGLPMYYDGGRIRKGQAGVVGDEIVEVDEEGATVIPAERMVSRGARYEELEDAGQTARPDTRALLSQPSGYEQEFGEADPLAQKEAELAEAMKVKPSKWKDFGFSLLSGLNNYLNGAKENRSYSEIKRDRRVAQIAPQVELLRKQRADKHKAQMDSIERTKAQADAYKARLQAIQQQNPRLWEAIEKKGYIDKADQQAIFQAGYGYIPEGDWRQFDTMYDKDGNLLYSPKTGVPSYKPTGINDPKQGTATFEGYPMKPSEAGRLKVDQAQFDATKVQDADKFNASQAVEVAKTNVANQMKWADDVRQVIMKAAEANAAILGSAPEAQGAAGRMEALIPRLQEAADAGDTEAFDKLQKEFNAAQEAYTKGLSKSAAGRELAAQLKKAMPPRPKAVTFTPIKAATTGKPIPKSKDPLGLFR